MAIFENFSNKRLLFCFLLSGFYNWAWALRFYWPFSLCIQYRGNRDVILFLILRGPKRKEKKLCLLGKEVKEPCALMLFVKYWLSVRRSMKTVCLDYAAMEVYIIYIGFTCFRPLCEISSFHQQSMRQWVLVTTRKMHESSVNLNDK